MNKTLCLLLILALLSACTPEAAAPTATPLPSDTHLPAATATDTPIPPTDTPTPTETLTPTPQPTATHTAAPTETISAFAGLPEPKDPPLRRWRNIPIMRGAIAGLDENDSYTYTIISLPEDVQDYYEQEILKFGAEPIGTGSSEKDVRMLIFTLDGRIFSIWITGGPDGLCKVMIVAG